MTETEKLIQQIANGDINFERRWAKRFLILAGCFLAGAVCTLFYRGLQKEGLGYLLIFSINGLGFLIAFLNSFKTARKLENMRLKNRREKNGRTISSLV